MIKNVAAYLDHHPNRSGFLETLDDLLAGIWFAALMLFKMLVQFVTKSRDSGIGISRSRLCTYWSFSLPWLMLCTVVDTPVLEDVVGLGVVG